MRVYGDAYAEEDNDFKNLYDKAIKMEGVSYHGTVKKDVLGKAMREATVMAYPNTYPETLCVTALEAQASGLPIVSTHAGALPEACHGDAAHLITIDPAKDREGYKEAFIELVVGACRNRAAMSKVGPKYDYSWKLKVEDWESLIFNSYVPVPCKINSDLIGMKKLDVNTKKIAILNSCKAAFNGDTYRTNPMGGSEAAIVLLSEEFSKKGYEVHVFCNCPSEGEYGGVTYHKIENSSRLLDIKPDVCIVSRNTEMIAKNNLKECCGRIVLWLHDLPESKSNKEYPKAFMEADLIVWPSEFAKEEYSKHFGVGRLGGLSVIANGVDTKMFDPSAEKDPYKLMYASIPFKGLHLMPDIFREIKKQVPQATLDVYSSMGLYRSHDEDKYMDLYKELSLMDGVTWSPAVQKKELGKAMSKASILCYPNDYRETFGIVAAEAQYAKLPIVSSFLGALPEVCNPEACVLVELTENKETYKANFVRAVVQLLKDQEALKKTRDKLDCQWMDWSYRADEWLNILFPFQMGTDVNSKGYWDEVYRREVESGKGREDFNRFKELQDMLTGRHSCGTLLDVGCGTGEWCDWIKTNLPGLEVWGSDISHVAIDKARERNRKVLFTNHPLEAPDFTPHYFDVITCCHTLEHIKQPEDMLEKFKRILKPDGTVIIVLPYKDEPYHEHFEIYDENNSIELLQKCGYNVRSWKVRKRGLFYKDGREFGEIILEARLNG